MKRQPLSFNQYTWTLRIKAGLSQLDVACALKLKSGQLVSNWERNMCRPPLTALPLLAKVYGVELRALFNRYANDVKKSDWEKMKGGE